MEEKLMYSYQAYGLHISSELELPELPSLDDTTQPVDLTIRFGKITSYPFDMAELEGLQHFSKKVDNDIYLYWEGAATFLIREDKEIIIDPIEGSEERRLRLFLLGACISVILFQKGLLVLHGSAVVINGQAAIFIGGKGWGKSTMAALLESRGHHFVCDDVAAIDVSIPESPKLLPGFPQIKLWPDAVRSLGHTPEEMPLLSSFADKRGLHLQENFITEPIPVKNIYVLDIDDEIKVQPLSPKAGVINLILHAYSLRFSEELRRQGIEKLNFTLCTEVAKSVEISLLKRPRSLSMIPQVAQLVEQRHN